MPIAVFISYGKRNQSLLILVIIKHGCKIEISKDICVQHNKWLITIEKPTCFFQSATGVQQTISFIRNFNIDSKISFPDKALHFSGKMMNIDNNFVHPRIFQKINGMLKQWLLL